MRTGFRLAAAVLALTLAPAIVPAQDDGGATSMTIYSTARPGAVSPDLYRPVPGSGRSPSPGQVPGYAVIKQERRLDLPPGRGEVRFVDVAALIDPTTVRFESLTDPEGTQVVEQNYQFDLVSRDKLLERYVDREITVEQVLGDTVESFTGTLLSTRGGLILEGAGGRIRTLDGYSGIRFPELPGGLITRPTLVWDVLAERGGPHRTRVTYQTSGMTWWADYNLVFAPGDDANRGTLDVSAWVSIINQSGASYGDAKLKLIAGDVHRAERDSYAKMGRAVPMVEAARAPGFEERAFFEYHLYTLGRPTTLPDHSAKQIELFEAARGVPVDKVLVYYGLPQGFGGGYGSPRTDRNFGVQSNPKVDVYLRFENSEQNGLGIPLPSGRVRVNQLDTADGSLEFIGEDVIDHTPRDEKVLIQLGSAFDVVGERRQTDFFVDTTRKQMEEEVAVELRNHKDEAVRVIVKENLYRWTNWTVLRSSHEWEQVDARTIHFPLTVPGHGEVTVTYRVRYTW